MAELRGVASAGFHTETRTRKSGLSLSAAIRARIRGNRVGQNLVAGRIAVGPVNSRNGDPIMARSFTGRSIGRGGILAPLLAAFAILVPGNHAAAASTEAERLVDESRISIERMLADPEFFKLRDIIGKARGVLIVPALYKGGFIVGVEGGSGIMMVRGADGTWSAPAFYTLAAGSIGFQIGGQVSEVVFTLMNDGAVRALLNDEFKFGADVGIAVGTLGAGLEASTTSNLDQDIYAFSKSV